MCLPSPPAEGANAAPGLPAHPTCRPTPACRRAQTPQVQDTHTWAALVCLPLLDSKAAAGSGDAPPCLGALTVGFASDADITGAALKAALLLARALVIEQRQALLDMSTLVTSLLLPPAPRGSGDPAADSMDAEEEEGGSGGSDFSGSELEDADCWTSSGGESETDDPTEPQGLRRRRRSGGSAAARHAASPTAAAATAGGRPCQGRLLAYSDPALERRFAAYHAVHMLGVDAAAYCICFLFFL